MSEREFRRLIIKRHGFKKLFELALSSVPLLAGSFFIYELIFTDWHTQFSFEEVMSATEIYVFSIALIALGVYSVFKTQKNYAIITIKLEQELNDYLIYMEKLSAAMNWALIQSKQSPTLFVSKGFWRSGYEILMAKEGTKLYFDIQHYSIGIIDLGVKRGIIRKLKRVTKEIQGKKLTKQ